MKFWKIIVAVLIFIGAQVTAGVVGILLFGGNDVMEKMAKGDEPQLSSDTLAILTVASGLVALLVIHFALRTVQFKSALTPSGMDKPRNWLAGLVGVLGVMSGIFAIDVMSEMVALPDMMQDTFLGMSQSTLGIICISVLGPLIEEMLFRESIEGYMLRGGAKPWLAIGTSALFFGLIHINPVQVVFAIPAGVLLGIVYWQTRNIWLCGIIHIMNNSMAMLQMVLFGEDIKDMSYTEMIGGTGPAIASMAGAIVVCVLLMTTFCKLYKRAC